MDAVQAPAGGGQGAAWLRLAAWTRRQWAGLLLLAGLGLFPFALGTLTGTGVESGICKFWQGQLIAAFIMAVYAMSYDVLMGYTGILSFGHAAFFGGGAYAMALFLKHVGPGFMASYRILLLPGVDATEPVVFAAGVLLAMVTAVVLGLLFSLVSARVRGVYFAMVTLAIAETLYMLAKATDFVAWTGADEGLHGVPVPDWINPTQYRLRFYFLALVFAVAMFLVVRRIMHSPTGRVFVALRENEDRARAIGYNPVVYRTLAFVTAALVAGLAGALFAVWNMGATPSMAGTMTTINALIMTILGGIGTLIGPMLGAALMQIFGQFLYQWFGARWPLVFGLIYVALVMFLPNGIVGTWRSRRLDWRPGWGRLARLLRPAPGA